MRNSSLEVKPLAGGLGAEILGVDLSAPLSNSEFDAVHQALLDNLVVFFRDQTLTVEQHKAFGRRFGELHIHPNAPKPIPGGSSRWMRPRNGIKCGNS